MELVTTNAALPYNTKYAFVRNYVDHRECHLEPDWLLIYKKEDEAVTLVGTGTHSDLCF